MNMVKITLIPIVSTTTCTTGRMPMRKITIEREILEALPIMGDAHLTVPKYHFHTQAAYAFACRFYLYYQKWDEAVKYTNLCIGEQPASLLRDWAGMDKISQTSYQAITNEFVNADINCNLLLMTSISNTGYIFNYITSEKVSTIPWDTAMK